MSICSVQVDLLLLNLMRFNVMTTVWSKDPIDHPMHCDNVLVVLTSGKQLGTLHETHRGTDKMCI